MKTLIFGLFTAWLIAADTLVIRPARWLRLPADVLWGLGVVLSVSAYGVARLFLRR